MQEITILPLGKNYGYYKNYHFAPGNNMLDLASKNYYEVVLM